MTMTLQDEMRQRLKAWRDRCRDNEMEPFRHVSTFFVDEDLIPTDKENSEYILTLEIRPSK